MIRPAAQPTQPTDAPCACRGHTFGVGPRAAPCAGCAISLGNLLAVRDACGDALGAGAAHAPVEHNHGTRKRLTSSHDTHTYLF